jgi:glycosyltransferase involved in cell wall biosynthesis
MAKKPILLIPLQWYHPGFRAGGITQAIRRMAEGLAGDYRIFILTTNCDLHSSSPYPDIPSDIWLPTEEGIQVKYLSSANTTCRQIAQEIALLQPDLIYLKNMFDPRFSLFPLWLKFRQKTNAELVMAPSGMLKDSALSLKSWKKKPLLFLIRQSGFYKKIRWQATDEQEVGDIKLQMGADARIWLLPEFPPKVDAVIKPLEKKGPLKLLFLSRIHPIKNLSFLLKVLAQVSTAVELTIGGPIEDANYMQHCEQLIKALPVHITVIKIGEVPHQMVREKFQQHHAYVLPTKGENYGYTIIEALCTARPVLISDQTPWKNLTSEQAGWDIPLSKPDDFVTAINHLAAMNQTDYDRLCENALAFAKKSTDPDALVLAYSKMFDREQSPSLDE